MVGLGVDVMIVDICDLFVRILTECFDLLSGENIVINQANLLDYLAILDTLGELVEVEHALDLDFAVLNDVAVDFSLQFEVCGRTVDDWSPKLLGLQRHVISKAHSTNDGVHVATCVSDNNAQGLCFVFKSLLL